jgi:predicted outer membrane repeat protein
VSGNSAGGQGGGISTNFATLTGCTVNGNQGSDGGGLFVNAEAVLINSSVRGNHASDGGGLSVGTATLTGSTVSGNSASVDGGGISAGGVTLTGSTVSGNSAGRNGGGIVTAVATLTNSTVSGNGANGDGGGIHTASLTLLNATITANNAHDGGGVFVRSGGTTSVRNTLIAGNFIDLDGIGPDLAGTVTSGGHNLIGDGSGSTGFTNGVNGDMVGTAANPIDPRLGPLANNGGPTRTHALLPGSPAIDHGDNTDAPATDQRGVSRPRDGDGNGSRIVDIGAFER